MKLAHQHQQFPHTAQKMKFFIKDFFSKFDQIRMKLRIWSHLLKKSLMENFIFCAVTALKALITILTETIAYIKGPLVRQWYKFGNT